MNSHCIVDENLSYAWGRVFLLALKEGEILPLVVTVTGFSGGHPKEDAVIRQMLDDELLANSKRSCRTVASTIFPEALWTPGAPRDELYERYAKILPGLKRIPANRNGLYFERMISHGPTQVNQLEHSIGTWTRGNRRRSALYAAIVDPSRDHTHQRQRGFPCLQQVAFTPQHSTGTLAITGFYNTQYLFERAYGNYLGLCGLGRFMAQEFGLTLSRMTCIAAVAKQEMARTRIESFAANLTRAVTVEQDDNA